MPLSIEEVKRLLALPQQNRGRGKKPKDWIDTSVRDYQTWFKLNHKLWDEKTDNYVECSNPNCQDDRTQRQMCAEVSGVLMCRICFLSEYMLVPAGQEQLPTAPQ